MVENIIVDTGLDMTLTFEEPEMDMEEYLVMEDDLEVGTVEQLIEDEMAGVSFVPIEEFEETPEVNMDVEMDEPTFEVEDMPVTVAVDSEGSNAHTQGPAIWKAKIEELDSKLKS